jgi:hypothetical protein
LRAPKINAGFDSYCKRKWRPNTDQIKGLDNKSVVRLDAFIEDILFHNTRMDVVEIDFREL